MSWSNLAYLLGSIFFALGTLYNVHIARQEPAPAPLEDEPGWDCRIHGNRICGPVQLVTANAQGYVYVQDGSGRTIAVVSPENIAH